MSFENKKKLYFLPREEKLNSFYKMNLLGLIKKYKSLWKKVSKKRRNGFSQIEKNKNLFFTPKDTLIDLHVKESLLSFMPQYEDETIVRKIYQHCIKNNRLSTTQKNKFLNERAYFNFYNKLSAKIDILKIIDLDRGKNLALNQSLACKFISLLTSSAGFVSSPLCHVVAAATRHGISKISDRIKIENAKNKLNHCITDTNFIKIISIILTTIHEPDFYHQERLDYFLDEQFLKFWLVFKKQANIDTDAHDLNHFWSTCLFEYFKKLKCPLLKANFVHCLDKISELTKKNISIPLEHTHTLPELNTSTPSIEPAAVSQGNIVLAQLIVHAVANYYLTQLGLHAAKLTKGSVAPELTFWNSASHNVGHNFNQPNPGIHSIFTPRLIASY